MAVTVDKWMKDGKRANDYGMIALNEESNVAMNYGYLRNKALFAIKIIVGYPGDKSGRYMHVEDKLQSFTVVDGGDELQL